MPQSSIARPVATVTPILSPQTLPAMEQAIYVYQDLVARGGWNSVPADMELQHRHARSERRRAAPPADRLRRPAPDERRRGGVRFLCAGGGARFQERHGLPGRRRRRRGHAEGAERAGACAAARSCRPTSSASGRWALPSERYIMVNVPGAQIEAVENGAVVSRHTAVVGKVDRQTPLLASQHPRDQLQSRSGRCRPPSSRRT